MRWVFGVLLVIGLVPRAFAQDFDILRGSEPVGLGAFTNWSGFYGGGQFGYSNVNADFSNAPHPLIASSLAKLVLEADAMPSTWPVLGSGSSSATGFGGFVGYNMQFQDLIVGVEANYSHAPATVRASESPILDRLATAGGLEYSVNVSATGQLTVTDYGSLRLRAGYVLNNFLPYGFVGFALGRGNYQLTTCVYGQQDQTGIDAPTGCGPQQSFTSCATQAHPKCVNYSVPNSATKDDAPLYGFSAGGGLDYAITQHFFLRGEFEYLQFAPIANIVAAAINAHVGIGLKF